MNRERTVAFDEERLAIVKDRLRDVMLSTITREMIEELPSQAEVRWGQQPHSQYGRGCAAQGPEAYGDWRRLQDHVTMLSEAEGAPIGRALTNDE